MAGRGFHLRLAWTRTMMRRPLLERMWPRVLGLLPTHIPDDPIFVLGNQKSGTSAIAALLAAHAGLDATIDLRREIRDQLVYDILSGSSTIEELIRRNSVDFSKPIIKHPNLTFVYSDLRRRFASARFVFVVRDPRTNIRSILDRLGLPGTCLRLEPDQLARLPRPWQLILSGEGLGRPRRSHVEALTERWGIAADIYLTSPGEMVLIRYEDFVEDKLGAIQRLAGSLGLRGVEDISPLVDRQFQPAGAHRGIRPVDFFGDAVLRRIEARCERTMASFGYERETAP